MSKTGPKPRPPVERFVPKVEKQPGGCWLWTGAANRWGYGNFWDGERTVKAHRWSYENFVGPIPEGLDLDHLCRTPACVNPDHLEPVTRKQNTRRGLSFGGKTCGKGHRFTPENTYVRPDNGGRQCRACRAATQRRYTARKRGGRS